MRWKDFVDALSDDDRPYRVIARYDPPNDAASLQVDETTQGRLRKVEIDSETRVCRISMEVGERVFTSMPWPAGSWPLAHTHLVDETRVFEVDIRKKRVYERINGERRPGSYTIRLNGVTLRLLPW